ncbi:MAG: TIGR04255 family protein [Oscillospiraceae bacterium]|nr:TIGR04255 family protein [Oscillospiraceae bacterium]
MFSNETRCIYRSNQLAEVICQLRFPEILTISANIPAEFQDAIRDEFPQYNARKESPAPKISGVPGNLQLENQPQTINYQFTSADGFWRVNLTSKFISLACSRYVCWENFAQKLDKPLAAFIKIYRPAYFERIGLRYVNFISRRELNLDSMAFSKLIQPCYLGPLAEEDVSEQFVSRSSVDTEVAIRGGCRAKIHAGPGMVKRNGQTDQEIKFILDQDLFMPGKIPVNLSAGALSTLHSQAYSIFRGAITDTLHDALEPDDIV